jgi:hypothetical protein
MSGTAIVGPTMHEYVGDNHSEPGYHFPSPDHHDPIGLTLGGVAVFVVGKKGVEALRNGLELLHRSSSPPPDTPT